MKAKVMLVFVGLFAISPSALGQVRKTTTQQIGGRKLNCDRANAKTVGSKASQNAPVKPSKAVNPS